jgi:hypothetical protein
MTPAPKRRWFPMMFACNGAVILLAIAASALGDEAQTKRIDDLIARLADTSEIGYGYSAQFSGSQFLPYAGAEQVQTLVLGSQPPARSRILEAIVREGAPAVPSLLKHLDDRRLTKIRPIKAMFWMSFGNEYDFNRRTRKDAPLGVNLETQPERTTHTITVGDLCFVA